MKRIFLFLIFCGFNLIYFQAISIHAQTNDAKYYVSVAVTYFKMHENETAQHYIDSALFINPSYAYAYIMLSKLTERNNGNHSETIQILHYAIKSAKKNIEKIQLKIKSMRNVAKPLVKFFRWMLKPSKDILKKPC